MGNVEEEEKGVDVIERLLEAVRVERVGPYEEALVRVRPVWFGQWEVLVLPVRPVLMPIVSAQHAGWFDTRDVVYPEEFASDIAESAVVVWAYRWALSNMQELLPAEPVQVEGSWKTGNTRLPLPTVRDRLRAELNSLEFPLGFVLERAAPDLFQQLTTGYQQLAERCRESSRCARGENPLVQAAHVGGVSPNSILYSAASYIILHLLSLVGPNASSREQERELERMASEYLELRRELESLGFNVAPLDTLPTLHPHMLTRDTEHAFTSMYEVLFPEWEGEGNVELAARMAVIRLGIEALRAVLELAQQDNELAHDVVSSLYSRVWRSKREIPLISHRLFLEEFPDTINWDHYVYIFEISGFLLGLWTARGNSSWLLRFAMETARTLRAVYGLDAVVRQKGDSIVVRVGHEADSVEVVIPPRELGSSLVYSLGSNRLAWAVLGPSRAVGEAVYDRLSTSPEGFALELDENYGPMVVARRRLRYQMLSPYRAGPQPSPYFLARELYRAGAPLPVAMRALYLGLPRCRGWDDDKCLRRRVLPPWWLMERGFALKIRQKSMNILELVDKDYDGSDNWYSEVGVLVAKTIEGDFAAVAFRGGFCCVPLNVKPLYYRRASTLAGLIAQVKQDIGEFRVVSTDIGALYRYSAAMVGLAEILEELGVQARLHPLYEIAFRYAYYDEVGLALASDEPDTIRFISARWSEPYMYIAPRVSGLREVLEGATIVDYSEARSLVREQGIFDNVDRIIRERGFRVKRYLYKEPRLVVELEDGTGIIF